MKQGLKWPEFIWVKLNDGWQIKELVVNAAGLHFYICVNVQIEMSS